MNPVARWRVAFLGLTALVIGLEIWASVDGDPTTRPWTDEIVDHVPWEVAAVLVGALLLWLPAHLGVRYWRKRRRTDGVR